MTTAKERWAARATRYVALADKLDASAAALIAGHNRDHAFMTQPGHIPARARQIAQSDRAHAMTTRATEYRAKARNLTAMATRNAGDAEAARQTVRDGFTLKAGDNARSVHYGPCVIVKVNAKSVRIRTASGFTTTQDKSYIKA